MITKLGNHKEKRVSTFTRSEGRFYLIYIRISRYFYTYMYLFKGNYYNLPTGVAYKLIIYIHLYLMFKNA
jgi:GT2 family glycosyltransferase